MKNPILLILCAAALLTGCRTSEQQLRERAAELCRYIPDHELLERSENFMTPDFWVFWYNVSGDTLQTVSGGSHAGRMTLRYENGEQLGDYVRRQGLNIRYYQDYGWPAVEL